MHIYLMVQGGTGKTTAAKIFARAINCLNPKDGEPCNECENCKSILEGNTTDVVEMDAASNNSVENIRGIRQEVAYATTNLKYRVYIIDEAHMLSTSAFNALLKTLEEPPANVVFILATTEESKILPTILSRCVRFEFKKISEENISNRLKEVLKKDDIEYEDKALEYIAKVADGGMRDGLSILERCIDFETKKVSYEKVTELIGTVNKDILNNLAYGILTYNIADVDKLVSELINSGKNLRSITSSILELFMELLVYNVSKQGQIEEKLKGILDKTSNTRLGYIIDRLALLDDGLRQSSCLATLFKAAILSLAIGKIEDEPKSELDKIKDLELRIEKLENEESKSYRKKENCINEAVEKEAPKEKKAEGSNIKVEEKETLQKKNLFRDLDKLLKMASDSDNLKLYSALTDVKGYEDSDKFIFETKNSFAYSILRKEDSEKELRKILQEITGEEKSIQINLINEGKETKNEFETFMANSGVPFEVID